MHWIALQPLPEALAPPGSDVDVTGPADVWRALGWWALQFTPRVARLDDALLLEVSASERLWGGRARLRQALLAANRLPAPVQHAQGATSLIAKARLQPGLARTPAPELPLTTLAAAGPHLATLAALGCTRWGQLRALPRDGVARRFGAPLLQALDQACGQGPDQHPWLLLPEVFDVSLELAAQVETAPALLFGARRLLHQLQLWLQLRQRAVLALVLRWTMDARRDTATEGELVLRCAEPTLDTTHLQRLLAERLAQTVLPAPVLYLQLRTLETVPRTGHSTSLLAEAVAPGDSLPQLLERLGARFGPAQLWQWQPQADHRPERMQRWQARPDATQLIANNPDATRLSGQNQAQDPAFLPTWLLATPQRLALRQGQPLCPDPLMLLAGPQRLETGWWVESAAAGAQDGAAPALRDYYVARSAVSGLLWVYRERLDQPQAGGSQAPRWYLHGLFA